MTPAIRAEGLGKRYRIGERAAYRTLRETLAGTVSRLGRRNGAGPETVWALRDVSLEVRRGEVVGLIGPNGAGKSTLLKVLSRITQPTTGWADIAGRVGSLLEVGTGFHPELTGRENIYLNGAVLGMKRREIAGKFDEIVDFSGVERFIDTPVKRYSSGMYLRLAFAVAAHLETEILLVDEVLAVGDAPFQKKCLGKMNEVARGGRTVLFVSHNMGAVQKLCTRGIVLYDGAILVDTDPEQAVARYLEAVSTEGEVAGSLRELPRQSGHGEVVRLAACRLLDADDRPVTRLRMGEPFTVEVDLDFLQEAANVSIVVGIDDARGGRVTTVASEESELLLAAGAGESRRIRARFDDLLLNAGEFHVVLGARVHRTGLDKVHPALGFGVSGQRHGRAEGMVDLWGQVRCQPRWAAGP